MVFILLPSGAAVSQTAAKPATEAAKEQVTAPVKQIMVQFRVQEITK